MSSSANYPYRSYDDNRSQALALHDLDLTGSLVRALANVMKEAAPVEHVEGLHRRPTTPKRKPPSRMGKRERAEHDARLAARRAALEELKADSVRLLAEREARRAKR